MIQRWVVASRLRDAEDRATRIIRAAEKEAETRAREAKLEAKDLIVQSKADLDKEIQAQRAEILLLEKRLLQKEESLDRKGTLHERRDEDLQTRERAVGLRETVVIEKEAAVERLARERVAALEQASGMTADQAKTAIMLEVEKEAKFEAAKMVKRIQDETKETADREAKEIITRSIQRITRDYVAESTISVVSIPNDSMKGRFDSGSNKSPDKTAPTASAS